MTQNILEQAKQGNPNAIAALMSRSMKSQGIDVQASLEDGCLQVYLEAAKVPSPQATVAFIRKGMANLDIESIDRVKVYARQQGEPIPAWQEDIVLREPPAPPPPPIPELDWDDRDDFGGSAVGVEENLLAGEDLFERTLLPTSRIDDSMVDESLYVETDEDDDLGDLPDDMAEFTSDEEEEMLRGTLGDDLEGLDDLEESPELDEDAPPMEADADSKPKRSALPLLLLLLAGLGLLGFYLFNQQPQLLSSIPGLSGLAPASDRPASMPDKSAAKPDAAADASKTAGKTPDAKSDVKSDSAEADKAEADKAEADKAEADKAEADKAEADKAEGDKAEGDKAEADKAEGDKAEADKAEGENAADAGEGGDSQTKEAAAGSDESASSDAPAGDEAKPIAAGSANDPFREAVNKAMSASELTQAAATAEDWNEVAAKWQAAIELMKSVPTSSPHYDLAQKKATEEYPKNLTYAQQRAEE